MSQAGIVKRRSDQDQDDPREHHHGDVLAEDQDAEHDGGHGQQVADSGRDGRAFAGDDLVVQLSRPETYRWALAAAAGASLKELMARLGHSSTRAALIYQHATRDRDQMIAKALDGLVRDVRSARSSAGT